MIEVFYNNQNPFSNIATVPIISKTNEMISYNSRWGQGIDFNLAGAITGCDFVSIISGQNKILDAFSRDFKNLDLKKDGNTFLNYPFIRVNSIAFEEDNYTFTLPFNINVTCYQSGAFTGIYGVIDPVNEFDFSETDEGTVEVTHTVSCKGFVTDSNETNALLNAKDFVHSLSGWNYEVIPHFINLCSGTGGFHPALKTQSERVNRFDGTYELTETYLFDPSQISGVYRYTTSFSSGINDPFSTVSIEGSIVGGKNYSPEELRNIYRSKDFYSPSAETYFIFAGTGILNPEYLSSGINEDMRKREISFDISFSDDWRAKTYLDYSVSTSYSLEDKLNIARINGEVKSRKPIAERFQIVKEYWSGINVLGYLSSQIDSNIYLNPKPINRTLTESPFKGELSFSVSYNDRPIPPSGLDEFQYEVAINPAIKQYVSSPILDGDGEYIIHNLNFLNRLQMQVNGNALIAKDLSFEEGKDIVKNELTKIRRFYMTGLDFQNRIVLGRQNITRLSNSNDKAIQFGYDWSFEAGEFTI